MGTVKEATDFSLQDTARFSARQKGLNVWLMLTVGVSPSFSTLEKGSSKLGLKSAVTRVSTELILGLGDSNYKKAIKYIQD